jgi:RNA polymerase sigma-70 factor (ECF subfamily)
MVMQAVAAITGPSGRATSGWYARNVADETEAPVTDPARLVFDEQALALADDVWRVARRLTRDPQAAEDLMQEAYTRAFRSWKQYEPGTNLRAWLLRIVHNLAIDNARRQQRQPEQLGLEADDYYPSARSSSSSISATSPIRRPPTSSRSPSAPS